jgi:hypothetical protein
MIAYKNKYHRILSCYFESSWEIPSAHALVELPWQFMKSDQFERLKLLMEDIKYLHLRIDLCNINGLIQDFIPVQDNLNEPAAKIFSFIKNNIQRLSLYRNLFSNLYFEFYYQFPAELDKYAQNWEFPWVETHEIPVQIDIDINSSNSLQCFSEFSFENYTVASIAENLEICFFLKQMGKVHCVSLRQNKEFSKHIPVRVQRILTMVNSKNGDYLGIAYLNGEIDLIRCHWSSNRELVESMLLHRLNYLLPEFEDPVISFKGSDFCYQDIHGEIVVLDATTGKASILVNQTLTQNGELSAILILDDYRIFCFRLKNDSLIIGLGSRDDHLRFMTILPSVDVVSSTSDENKRIYLATSDFHIREYLLDKSLKEIKNWGIKDHPKVLHYWNQNIIWTSEGGNLFFHKLNQINDYPSVSENHIRYRNTLQIKTLNEDTLALASGSRVSLMAAKKNLIKNPLIASFLNNDNTYTLIQREKKDLYLINSEKKGKQIFWKDADKDIFICPDGVKNILVVGASGTGVYKDSHQNVQFLNNLPPLIKSIHGLKEGGFLLLDANQILYRMNSNLYVSLLTDLRISKLSKQRLVLLGKHLVVFGLDLLDENSYRLFFYKIDLPGNRFKAEESIRYYLHEIEINNLLWDDFNEKLIMIGRTERGWNIKQGLIHEYLNKQEKSVDISTPDPVIQSSALSDDGKGIWIISSKGTLFYINIESLKTESMLSSIRSVLHLGHRTDNMVSDHFISEGSRIIRCCFNSVNYF